MIELPIDPAIRVWVFFPIVLITFLIGILRHYLYILCTKEKTPDIKQIADSQAIIRARLLRENGKYLPEKSFAMRKEFFNDEISGYFRQHKQTGGQQNVSSVLLQDTLKGDFFNALPMILIGGWINVMFSGFLITKVPFPLTIRFKSMLQAGIDLEYLDAAWVSSTSWYLLNIFGLRPIYALIFDDINMQVDSTVQQANFFAGTALAMSANLQAAFKNEREALDLLVYENALSKVDGELVELAKATVEK